MLEEANDLVLAGKHKMALNLYYKITQKNPLSKEGYLGMLKCTLALKYYRHSIKTIFLLNGIHPKSHLGHSLFLLKNSLLTHIRKIQDIKLLDFSIEMMNKSASIAQPINKSAFLEIQSDLLYEKGEAEQGLMLKCNATIQKVKRYKNLKEDDSQFIKGKLPDFLILGAQKTGTTALYEFVTKHPKVYPALRKELFFFSDKNSFSYGINWYKSNFTGMIEKNILTTEATATYFNDFDSYTRINNILGKNIKKIFIFRNPSDRAISDYYMKVREGHENRDIFTAMNEEIQILDKLSEKDLMELIEKPSLVQSNIKGYVLHGMYYYYLKIWLEYSSHESIYVVSAEDLYNKHNEVLKGVFNFLNIDDKYSTVFKIVNQGKYSKDDKKYQDIHNILNSFFRKHNNKLDNLLSSGIV